MNARTLEGFRLDQRRVGEILAAALDRIEQMPTTTVEEVEAKDSEYRRTFIETDEYDRYRHAMDAWCAAFSYEKRVGRDQDHLTNVQLVDFLHPDAEIARDTLDLIDAESVKEKNRFFHWALEFPSVFRRGGFDAVVGNPPYIGGSKVSGTLGHHYNSMLRILYSPYQPRSDLAAAFVRRFDGIRRSGGRLGVITTNSITKGDTRDYGLAEVVKRGRSIVMARPNTMWTGAASVIVALFVIADSAERRELSGAPVDYISSRLDSLPESDVKPLRARLNVAFVGDVPIGAGFIVTPELAKEWIRQDKRNAEALYPFLTGEDLLQQPDVGPSRWIICFHDWPLEKAKQYPRLLAHVEEYVRPSREGLADAHYREKWWQFGRYLSSLRRATARVTEVIVKSVTGHVPGSLSWPMAALAKSMNDVSRSFAV